MRPAFPAAALALLAAAPASATSGLSCRSVEKGGPNLDLTIGHGAGPAIVAARFTVGMADNILDTLPPRPAIAIAQSWIDDRVVWVDVTNRAVTGYYARLRAAFQPQLRGRPALGTIEYEGTRYRVRCVEA